MTGDLLGDIAADLRARWPDAPRRILALVTAGVVLRAVLRRWNQAACAFDDATKAWAVASSKAAPRLERLELAAAAERARLQCDGWAEVMSVAARLYAAERDRYGAWKARRTRRAELRGETPDPVYVLPEDRGDAFEGLYAAAPVCAASENPSSVAPFVLEARKTLAIWSRWHALHT